MRGIAMWDQLIISMNISRLLKSSETLERNLTGKQKKAHDKLVKLGAKALAYTERLKSGSSSNPLENYSMRSDAEKYYRYIIEMKQARIMDVIEEIEHSGVDKS
jgi:heme oxygenase